MTVSPPRAGSGRCPLHRGLAKAQRIRATRLEIETGRETIRLSPFPRYRPGGPDRRLGMHELSTPSGMDPASYVERDPFAFMLMAATPLAFWLRRRPPLAERVVVAALTVVAPAVAVRPGLLQFNAATAEPQVVDYVPTAPGRFGIPAGEYPDIGLSDHGLSAYWAQR